MGTVSVSLAEIEAAEKVLARKSLHHFVRLAWNQVESTTFIDNWHVKLYCDHLEAVYRGEIENLLWNSPPGTGKSVIEAVFFPAWAWANNPRTRFLFICYGQELSTRDSVACRKLIQSPWYQRKWSKGRKILDGRGKPDDHWPGVELTDDQNQKIRFDNTAGGWRIATSVGGRGTGEHPDIIIGGDLHKASDADSADALRHAIDFWDSTVGTRGVIRGSRRVVSGQRLATEDISGHLIRQGGFVKISLPMEWEPGLMEPTPIGGMDPRTAPGELLFPAAIPQLKVDEMKARLRHRASAQLQQNPKADVGAVYRRDLFRYYEVVPTEQPTPSGYPKVRINLKRVDGDGRVDSYSPADCYWLQTIDTAIKVKQHNDPTAIGTFLITPDNDLLVWDMFNERIEVPDQFGTIVSQRGRFPHLGEQCIEDAASGSGIIQEGRRRGITFVVLSPIRDKIDNASVVATDYANHQVWHPSDAPAWLEPFERQLLEFGPGCKHDDMADTLAYAGRRKLERSLQRHGVHAAEPDEVLPTFAELMGDMMPKLAE